MPKLHPINSSVVSAAGYNKETQELTVHLRSGAEYVYHDVPKQTFDSLMAAHSRGRFFVREISKGFRFTRRK